MWEGQATVAAVAACVCCCRCCFVVVVLSLLLLLLLHAVCVCVCACMCVFVSGELEGLREAKKSHRFAVSVLRHHPVLLRCLRMHVE